MYASALAPYLASGSIDCAATNEEHCSRDVITCNHIGDPIVEGVKVRLQDTMQWSGTVQEKQQGHT
jgi:hypothetical protein